MCSLKLWCLALGVVVLFVKGCHCACSGVTCGECIASGYDCAWCLQKNFTESRCQPKTSLMADGCEADFVEDPKASMQFAEDEAVRDSSADNAHAIQVQPQRVRIVTRPRKEHTIPMTFRAANNFPVDLYFLFDNSLSMESHIKSLAKLANDIGQAIGDISRNYRMGYGVFQDKVILPFTDTSPEKLINPCASTKATSQSCAAPFEFKHLLNMTDNVDKFKQEVDRTQVTGNLDHPEGSIDAILQAVECKDEIGWRTVGRKLLIFASNDRFHLAGDGRLAGIVIPNDGLCHLDGAGKYAKELQQDYPSVGQLTHIVEKNEVHIIFAVSRDQANLFQQLSSRIPQSIVELLASEEDDPSNKNIKDIIEKKYREMISEVELVHNNAEGVDIQIKARSEKCETLGTSKCKGIEIGIPVQFDVVIKVTGCPTKPEDKVRKVIIHPDSLKSDQLVLEIETVCECDCGTDKKTWEIDSDICSDGNGTLKCGLCDCHGDRFGQFCECDSNDLDASTSGCTNPAENSTVQCSGAGKCECGECKCDDGYSGRYCECNDRACGRYKGEVCGGVRGSCQCGECVCVPGYKGSTCECATSNLTCIFNKTICNDAGTCECGACQCKKGYTGDYCQDCFLCGNTVCEQSSYRTCAECAFAEDENDCPADCPETKLVDVIDDSDETGVCSSKQADGCFLRFRIISSEGDTNITILVQKTTTCPEPVNVLPIALGVVGGVVAIGLLLLLLWKILTSIFDRIEYAKFQDDLKHCKWAQQDNPFYKGATTTYKNPMLDTSEPLGDDK